MYVVLINKYQRTNAHTMNILAHVRTLFIDFYIHMRSLFSEIFEEFREIEWEGKGLESQCWCIVLFDTE